MSIRFRVVNSAALNWRNVNRGLFALGAMAAIVTAAPTISCAQSFQGLGFLPGYTGSNATGISADGTVVVGTSIGPNSSQAFRWTAVGGMVGLGFVPGDSFPAKLPA